MCECCALVRAWCGVVPLRALTVHSHGRSQRVSLRGVSSVAPFLRRLDQVKAPMGRTRNGQRAWTSFSLQSHRRTTGTGITALSLPDASRPFVVWDAGTRPMEAAPAESPPPLPAPDRRETKGHNALDVSGSRVDDKCNYLKKKEAFLTMIRKQIVNI